MTEQICSLIELCNYFRWKKFDIFYTDRQKDILDRTKVSASEYNEVNMKFVCVNQRILVRKVQADVTWKTMNFLWVIYSTADI
jgi:hypothetical protein